MAICKKCGSKYSKFTTPVSAKGVCRACFESELFGTKLVSATVTAVPDVGVPKYSPVPEQLWLPSSEIRSEMPIGRARSTSAVRWSWFVPRTRSKAIFAFTMGCYCLFLSSFVSAWAYVAGVERRTHRPYSSSASMEVFMDLIAAPVIESMILIGIVGLVRKLRGSACVQIFIAGLFMSVPHGTLWWPWAVAVMPVFCIQAASYLYWWRRDSWMNGYWVVVLMHALGNLLPTMHIVAGALHRQ